MFGEGPSPQHSNGSTNFCEFETNNEVYAYDAYQNVSHQLDQKKREVKFAEKTEYGREERIVNNKGGSKLEEIETI